MNLRQMEVFHAIMRTGSVTAAARLLNLSQPAVSGVLKHCEIQLKAKLFERVSGRLEPTPEAKLIYPEIVAIFDRVDFANNLVRDLTGGRVGSLSIAAVFPVVNGALPRIVSKFTAQRPNIRVTVQSLSAQQVLQRVVNREVDVGITYASAASDAIEKENITSEYISCVVPKSHPLEAKDVVSFEDLRDQPIITYLPQINLRSYIDKHALDADIELKVKIEVNLSLTAILMARQGCGIALVDASILDDLPIDGVVSKPLDHTIDMKINWIFNRSSPKSQVLLDFIELANEQFRR